MDYYDKRQDIYDSRAACFLPFFEGAERFGNIHDTRPDIFRIPG